MRWQCYTRHGDGQLNDDKENLLLSVNLISIKTSPHGNSMRVHYEMEVSSFASDVKKKALEYLVYLLFADHLSHFSTVFCCR